MKKKFCGVASNLRQHRFCLEKKNVCCRYRKTSFRPALQDCKFSVVPFMPSLSSPSYGTVHTIFFIHKFRHLFVFRYVSFIKMETHFSAVFFPSFSAPFFLSLFHTHIDPSEMSCCLRLGPGRCDAAE